MASLFEDDALAPKVFFLSPDPGLVTLDFLEEAFLQGFECYSLKSIGALDHKAQVESLIEAFPELLLFFTIGREEPLDPWAEFLYYLQTTYAPKIRIGILHTPTSADRDQEIRSLFLVDIGIQGGTIPLTESAKKNRSILMNVLTANQAAGRRREIRMPAGAAFDMIFTVDGQKHEEEIVDLSVSFFAVEFQGMPPGWDVGTEPRKIQLRLAGLLVTVEAVVALRRVVRGKTLFIFLFQAENDHRHLLRSKVNQFIFQYYQDKMMEFVERRFG